MDIVSVYNDSLFQINKAGGYLSAPDFNGISRRAELKLLDLITGNLKSPAPPNFFATQKAADWLSKFIETYPAQAKNGRVDKPKNYYGWDNAYILGDYFKTPDCTNEDTDDDVVKSDCNVPIEILQGQQFYNRCNTSIKGLKPSFTKPICKMVGSEFEFSPKDIGSIKIEYVRYPVFGELKMTVDPVYNVEVPDTSASKNYEWDEYAREYLIWFIVDIFSNSTREKALKESNILSKPE